MQFVSCTAQQHAAAILEIFNEAILNSTALYDYYPRTMDTMANWFRVKQASDYPVIGVENEHGVLMGFASYGMFRERPAYKYSVEHSVYVHKDHRAKGLGLALMHELIAAAREQQFHVLVGGVDTSNGASIAMHEKLGFTHAGTIRQAGFKFGRWLDLAFYQLILETPRHPADG